MSDKFILPLLEEASRHAENTSALYDFITEWTPVTPNNENSWREMLTKVIEEVLREKSDQIANLEAKLERFTSEWSNRFGFMAVNNSRESVESVDEVAGILNRKQANLEAENERLRKELRFYHLCVALRMLNNASFYLEEIGMATDYCVLREEIGSDEQAIEIIGNLWDEVRVECYELKKELEK